MLVYNFTIFFPTFFPFFLSKNHLNLKEVQSTNFLHQLFNSKYEKDIRPLFGSDPLLIDVSISVNDISAISEQDMQYTIDMYVGQTWNDPRLAFHNLSNIPYIVLTREYADKIWLPDTYISNSKKVDFHKTISDKDTTQLAIGREGDVLYTIKVSVVARCSMDLTYFPVDQQRCSLKLLSYSKADDSLVYRWQTETTNGGLFSYPDINLPSFRLLGYNRRSETANFTVGPYSTLILDIFIARNIAFYVTRIYLPAFLVVVISFVPFWLDRDSHARVALGVTTVLTMTTLITNTNSELPKISHLTALDVYLFFCFILVFLSLIEYATVGYYDMVLHQQQIGKDKKADKTGDDDWEKNGKKTLKLSEEPRSSVIDCAARRLFPFVFLIFNLIYILWLFFIVLRNGQVKIEIKV